ncbi:unnamed protein product [Alopecurus aequalis]
MALLSDLVAHSRHVPSSHIRAVGDRPDHAKVDHESGASIPVIDLEHLDGPGRDKVVEAIGSACETDGFFMVKNHGIPEWVVEGILRVAREFFHLPESERLKCCSDDPKKAIRLSTSFNVPMKKASNWRDVLRLHCYPLESFVDQWPSNPPAFRQEVGNYSTEARALTLRLLEAISESLGLERGHMVKAMGRHAQAQQMALNYYPPCPQPELTYGLPPHRDCNAITLLLQDGVSGLQFQRGGHWVAIDPVPNVLLVNIGDQLQVLSNDRYKSVSHRAIVNSESERISVPTIYCPSPDTVVAPADALVDDDHPLAYRPFTYEEYNQEYWKTGLDSTSCLHKFRHIE